MSSFRRQLVDFLDIFRVVSDDQVLSGKTRAGGILSFVCTAAIVVLIVSETVRFLSPGEFQSSMAVNRREMGKRERVNFNISFLHFPCGSMMHESFQPEAGLRLTKQEQTLQWRRVRLLQGDPNLPIGDYDNGMGVERTLNEGCRVEGSFMIDKVPSNFIFALRGQAGPAVEPPPSDHIFHDLWFGEKRLPLDEIPEALGNALGGVKRAGDPPRTVYQYFLSIVPTVVTTVPGSSDERHRHVGFQYTAISSTVQAYVPPGIYFAHKHSPIAVEMARKKDTWSHFLVGIASVSGGVYVCCELCVMLFVYLQEQGYIPRTGDDAGGSGGGVLKS